MERKLVSAKVENGVRYIMLDSPASFNVIDITLMTDLLEALQVAQQLALLWLYRKHLQTSYLPHLQRD